MTTISTGIEMKQFRPGVGGGGGSGYDAASDAIFAAFTTPPTTARKTRINDAVVALKAGGVWAKLDALYCFAAADSQAAKVNWIQPGTYNCTEVLAPAFTVDQGFTGASTKYLDTGFNPTTAPSPKYVRDSATVFGWSLLAGNSSAGGMFGSATRDAMIIPRGGDIAYFNIHSTGFLMQAGQTDGSGFYSGSRTSAAALAAYKNGAAFSMTISGSLTSVAPLNENLRVLNESNNSWVPGTAAWGGFGSQLSAGEHSTLYEALLAYLTGIATDAIAAAFTTPPTAPRKSLIQTCVGALMRTGVWNKLDALHMFAAADSQAALINWVKPGTYNATEVNAPTFTTDTGYAGDGASKQIATGFIPSSAPSPKHVINDASIFGWSNTSTVQTGPILGGSSVGQDFISLYARFTGDHYYSRISVTTGTLDVTAVTDGKGFLSATRSSSVLTTAYKNGVSVGTSATASAGVENTAFRYLAGSVAASAGQIMVGGIGAGLTAAESLALYNALNAYIASTRIFAAFSTPPTVARQTLIQNAVASLMTAGVWDKLDALYLFAAADSQAAKINWVQPGTYNATELNAPAFVADRGFTGNLAGAKALDSSYNPTTAPSPKFTLNSATLFANANNDVTTNSGIMGNNVAPVVAGSLGIIPHHTNGNAYYLLNEAAIPFVATSGVAAFHCATRRSSTASEYYRNGVSVGTSVAAASGALASSNIFLAYGAGFHYDGQIGACGFGSQLSAAEQLALYNALRTYLTGVGVP